MVDTNWEDLQQLASRNYNLDLQGALRKATGLRLDVYGIVRRLFGKQNEPNEVFAQLSNILASHALLLPGTSGAFISTPDAPALDIVGDIDMRVEFVDYAAFHPDVLTTIGGRGYIAKWAPAANQSYKLELNPLAGTIVPAWSSTGANSFSGGITYPNRQPGAWRVTIDVDNGAAGRTISIFTAPSMDGPFTEIAGSPLVQGTVTSIFASTAALVLGASSADGTASPFMGRITRAQVRAGINGTVVANPDFRALAPGTTSFADSAGLTWTVQGTARIV